MTLRRTIILIIAWWQARRVRWAYPEVARAAREVDRDRRQHRQTRAAAKALRERVHNNLRREIGL